MRGFISSVTWVLVDSEAKPWAFRTKASAVTRFSREPAGTYRAWRQDNDNYGKVDDLGHGIPEWRDVTAEFEALRQTTP